jgi:hypothetical protein
VSAQPVPESRVYRHQQCGSETEISGQAFEVASNPLSDMTRTWCNQCNAFFSITEFQWSDSGETIADYYARHGAKATSTQRFLCSKKFMIVCAVTGLILGAVGGFFLFRNSQIWLQIFMIPFVGGLGAFVACAIYVELGKLIVKRACGVKDTRVLT